MFDKPKTIQELFGFDHGTVATTDETHPIRTQYPELVGVNGINAHVKQNWQITDLIPICIIILILISMVIFFGFYRPAAKLTAINSNIAKLSTAFDQRANQINSLGNRLNQFVIENELSTELQTTISIILNSVNTLSEDKPNEIKITKRFEAETEFAKLSHDIIKNRDLSAYGELALLPDDFTDNDIINRGIKTLELTEVWRDDFSRTEEKALDLLETFNEKVMPKRRLELQASILNEWKESQSALLLNWKQLKDLEITLIARSEAIKLAQQRQEEYEQLLLEKKNISDRTAFEEPETQSQTQTQVIPKVIPKRIIIQPDVEPTNTEPTELELRKRAATKLLD